MSKRGDFELICDIKEAIKRIEGYLDGLTFEKFLKDIKSPEFFCEFDLKPVA